MNEPTHQHAADRVFDAVATAVLNGEIAPGTPIPAERLLAEQHGTSRIIVRQAVHRLADYGLLQTHQGSATIARDPEQADLRIIELVLRLDERVADRARALRRDLTEYQVTSRLALLDAAHRRANADERAALVALVSAAPLLPSRAEAAALETRFWQDVTAIGQNNVLAMEMRWWDRLGYHAHSEDSPAEQRWFYRQLAKRLSKRQDPIPYYLTHVRSRLAAART